MRPRTKRTRRKSGDLNYYGIDSDRYPQAEAVFRSTLARLDEITKQLSDAAMDEKPISARDIYRIRADVETILAVPFRPIIYVGAEWPQTLLDLIPVVDCQSAKN
jgi:hypothetical protein